MSAATVSPMSRPLPTPAEMHRAFFAGDPAYDGLFVTAVTTTGIFCRPSCPARKPKAENIRFYAAPNEALFAGYRPCKRCKPLEDATGAPGWLAPLLAEIEAAPTRRIGDKELRARGLEPARVRRHFKANFGMTFQAYCRGRRLNGAFTQIKAGGDLDEIAESAGYDSPSGFRAAFGKSFGAAPRKADAEPVRLAWIDSPIGPLVAGAVDAGVCLLEFTDRRALEAQLASLGKKFPGPLAPGDHPHLDALRVQLAEYFAGARRAFTLPLVAPGTPFEEKVWAALLKIPCGEVRGYAELARSIGHPGAARAVGRANGLNRIAILIPCHRVVNADGTLCGYGGGLWRKARLLEIERGDRAPGLPFAG